MNTPTTRSLELLRSEGYTVAITEHWNAYARIRQDLFGFIDLIAIKEGVSGVLAIQTTTAAHVSARFEKIAGNPVLKVWLLSGNKIEIHGWGLRGKRGQRKLWTVIRKPVTF